MNGDSKEEITFSSPDPGKLISTEEDLGSDISVCRLAVNLNLFIHANVYGNEGLSSFIPVAV